MQANLYAILSRMTHVVGALAHPSGAASHSGTGTYWLAIGLLIGIVTARFAPGWLTGLIVLFDLIALGWSAGILNYIHSPVGRWVLGAVVFLMIGLYFGVTNGLKHLSESEMKTRLGNIRKNGRYF